MNTSQFVRRLNAVVSFSVVAIVATAFSLVPAFADTDPFPAISLGGEIGSRQFVSPSTGMPLDGSPIISCPTGAGLGAVADGIVGNYVVCTKTWRPSTEIDADLNFRNAQESAVAAATLESQTWNAAHPGEQKCVQWGPIVHANGVSTASGGVCANPVAAPTSSSSESETSTPVVSPAPTPSETSTPVVVSTSTPTPTPTASAAPVDGLAGVGGWAVIDSAGKVYGVIVCDNAVCGTSGSWGGVMPVEYMGCPIGCRLVLQTSADPQTGNVAGWRSQEGTDVIYNSSSNTFSVQQTNQSQPSLIITPPSANSYSFSTLINQTVVPSASESSTAGVETITVTTNLVPSPSASESSTVSVPSATVPVVALEPMAADFIPLESDGEEIDSPPAADISVKKESSGKYLISLGSNIYEETLMVRAFKKGLKIVIYKVTTNIDGLAAIRTSRNLSGFKLAVYVGKDFLDSTRIP
jgi:hypothetical protein